MTTADLSIWVTAAATIATAVATAVLAVVTWLLFKATRRMAEATSEPYVVATIEPNRWSFIHTDLLVENTGTGPAFDVQLSFDPPLQRERGGAQIDLPLNAIAVLRPSQSLRNFIGNGTDFLKSTYRVSISWKASPNAKSRTTNSYDLNISHYEGLIQLGGGDPLVQIAQELKKVGEALERLTRGPSRLGVDVYSEADRNRERKAQVSWYEQGAEVDAMAELDAAGAEHPDGETPTPKTDEL